MYLWILLCCQVILLDFLWCLYTYINVFVVAVRQIFVCDHTMKFDNICWKKGHVNVGCSVHWLSTRHLCSMLNKSCQSTCLLMIYLQPQTNQTVCVTIDERLLLWQLFNSRLVFSLTKNLKPLQQLSYLCLFQTREELLVMCFASTFALVQNATM